MENQIIIINHGRGRQALWPSTDAPVLYSAADAAAIVEKYNSERSVIPGGSSVAHAQPIGSAADFVTGTALHRVQDLQYWLEEEFED